MEWWPNEDASWVPVFDGGPQRGLSLAASSVLITRGVSNGGSPLFPGSCFLAGSGV
jgi:hypothetical protein